MLTAEHARRTRRDRAAAAPGFEVDYADCFAIASVPGVRPREWAACALHQAKGDRTPMRLAWRLLLGFDLLPARTPAALAGWAIRSSTTDQFVLETEGRLMSARMTFSAGEQDLLWATFLHFHGPAGQLAWAMFGPAHRALVPRCLERTRHALLNRAPRIGAGT